MELVCNHDCNLLISLPYMTLCAGYDSLTTISCLSVLWSKKKECLDKPEINNIFCLKKLFLISSFYVCHKAYSRFIEIFHLFDSQPRYVAWEWHYWYLGCAWSYRNRVIMISDTLWLVDNFWRDTVNLSLHGPAIEVDFFLNLSLLYKCPCLFSFL